LTGDFVVFDARSAANTARGVDRALEEEIDSPARAPADLPSGSRSSFRSASAGERATADSISYRTRANAKMSDR